ncbi:hypothetical protein CRM22_002875 [Opisthorchis felineus]|nr:hypothetical protein CRM22_002875 [Opisthorchis felineus]
MECEKDEKECLNCGASISLGNFTVHEAFCVRNLVKCPTCNSVVPKVSFEEHSIQEHALTRCEVCKMRIPKFKLANHQGTCPARLIVCSYCELEFPANSYEEHVDRCSSRTELCSGCRKFVMLRDLQTHACVLSYPFESGTKKPEPTGDPDFTSDLELATRLQYMELNQAVSKLVKTEQASMNQEVPRKSYTQAHRKSLCVKDRNRNCTSDR